MTRENRNPDSRPGFNAGNSRAVASGPVSFWAAAAPTRAGDFLFTHHTLVVAYQLVRLLISSLV